MAGHERGAPSARTVTSLQNERVKLIRSLEMRKARRETGLFVAEGASILMTARDAGWRPTMLAFLAGAAGGGAAAQIARWAIDAHAECLEVSGAVLAKIAAKDNPQSMLGVFRQRWGELPDPVGIGESQTWLALEEVRDPGNLGTIIRTLDAVGGSGIILVGNCCDPYARECVRATMGSIFAVPLVRASRQDFLQWRARWRGDVVGTHLAGSEDFRSAAYRGPRLLVMGSEGPGMSPEMAGACSRLVKIPMAGRLDSLNLAVATALVLYQIQGPQLKLDN